MSPPLNLGMVKSPHRMGSAITMTLTEVPVKCFTGVCGLQAQVKGGAGQGQATECGVTHTTEPSEK